MTDTFVLINSIYYSGRPDDDSTIISSLITESMLYSQLLSARTSNRIYWRAHIGST